MGKLYYRVRSRPVLRAAWGRIRENGLKSSFEGTRDGIREFNKEPEQNINRIQRYLKDETFVFKPQTGIAKKKASGGRRGIVMAPVENRIVERAILDVLQNEVPEIRAVLDMPTSVGGVPERSVPHGLHQLNEAFASGYKYYVRSDIKGFFEKVPRQYVLKKISNFIHDEKFLDLLDRATQVYLENETALGEDRQVFPTNEEGVAQGSPLSPLLGNIVLENFDKKFNDRGIITVRFIDDFVMLAKSQKNLHKAFLQAQKDLKELGLECHNPIDVSTDKEKASHGTVDSGFVFLGYYIKPPIWQPSRKARRGLIEKVDAILQRGRVNISETVDSEHSFHHAQRYIQTLELIDRTLRGWGDAFAYCNMKNTFEDLDKEIEGKLEQFREFFKMQTKDLDWKSRRRGGGVGLLEDVKPKSLDDVPFRFPKRKPHRRTKNVWEVYTDGAVITSGRKKSKDRGRGGWAAVFASDKTCITGFQESATNTEMELRAVVEAVRSTPEGAAVHIKTDSQHISQGYNGEQILKTNSALWRELLSLESKRNVKVTWVKGHAGDELNELADRKARETAEKGHP